MKSRCEIFIIASLDDSSNVTSQVDKIAKTHPLLKSMLTNQMDALSQIF